MSSLDAFLAALHERCPEPWLAWLAVALCRQRLRQRWLIQIRDTHLQEVDEDHDEVPGLPGWRFSFHGRGLLLERDGESLDVDFFAGETDGETLDPYFVAGRLLTLRPAALPEAQCQGWFGGSELLVRGLQALRARGLLDHPSSPHVFHLAGLLRAHWEAVAAVDFADRAVADTWRSALGDDEPGARGRFLDWLQGLVRGRRDVASIVRLVVTRLALADAVRLCVELLGPIDATTGAAVEALDTLQEAPSPEVVALLDRLDPARHHPYAPQAVLAYVLRRGIHRDEALVQLSAFAAVERVEGYNCNPMADRLTMLLLEFDPARAFEPLRRTLRRGSPACVATLTSLLVQLGEGWCRRELESAAAENLDPMSREVLEDGLRGEVPSWVVDAERVASLAGRLRGRFVGRRD